MSLPDRYPSWLKTLAINRYLIFLFSLLCYTEIAQHYGGLPSFWKAWRLEIPLTLYLYYYFNLITRPSRLQPLITAGPIVLFYVGVDVYFVLFGRLPHLVEFNELHEMFQVFPLFIALPLAMVIGLPLAALLTSVQFGRPRSLLLGVLPVLGMALVVELLPNFFYETFRKTQGEIVFYSDVHSTRNNGRLGMMLYNEALRKRALDRIAGYRGNSIYREEFDKAISRVKAQGDKRNVHLIVLESFLDPTLLQGAQFSPRPVDPAFDALFRDKAGFSVSPVFAGGTAQAEFEVLCGVPAMRELSGVEFNVFTGAKTFCLPNILSQGGYQADSSNAFVPDFFNSTKAYDGMGFDQTYYPQEYAVGRETYFSRGDVVGEKYIFDGDLFSQNLAHISKWIRENPHRPIFNYINSIYGHSPNNINTRKRPEVIKMVSSFKDEQLKRSANQYYYRTKAIADFVKGLLKIDPRSLIILVSDHLPPLTYGPNTYRDLNYLGGVPDAIHQNRIYIIENGQTVQYSTIHHFDIPRIVLNYVTKGQYCKEHVCDFKSDDVVLDKEAYRDEYMTIMAQAMGCSSPLPSTHQEKASRHEAASPAPPPQTGA